MTIKAVYPFAGLCRVMQLSHQCAYVQHVIHFPLSTFLVHADMLSNLLQPVQGHTYREDSLKTGTLL